MGTKKDESLPRTIPGFLVHVLRRIAAQRRWWLLPVWVLLAMIGLLLLIGGGSYLLPAIYIAF